jgi:hypothetical protein
LGQIVQSRFYDAGIYNYPSDIQSLDNGYLVAFRSTDGVTNQNSIHLLEVDDSFDFVADRKLSLESGGNLNSGELLYQAGSRKTYFFYSGSFSGFVIFDESLDTIRTMGWPLGDINHTYNYKGEVYFSDDNGAFCGFKGDELQMRTYSLETQYSGIRQMDLDTTEWALYGTGLYTDFSSNRRRVAVAKSFIQREMSCGSFSRVTPFAESEDLQITEENLVPNNTGNTAVKPLSYNWTIPNIVKNDSCRIHCQPLDLKFTASGDELNYTFTVENPDTNATYEWLVDGTPIFGTGPMIAYSFAQEGNFEVCSRGYNICSSDTSCNTVTVMRSNAAAIKQSSLQVYPNPVNNRLFVQSEQQIERLEILSVYGQLIRSYASTKELFIEGLIPGNYLLMIEYIDGQRERKMFIKQ